MLNKLTTITVAIMLAVVIIFWVTYFNQDRYYSMLETHRQQTFKIILKMQQQSNTQCLRIDTQATCYQRLLTNLDKLNPDGAVYIADSRGKLLYSQINEGHRDDRKAVEVSRTFQGFSQPIVVKLSKLTRHSNLYQSSLNAMFFSVADYYHYFLSRVKGQPSSLGEYSALAFAKYVAWGRFYPILPIWIIVVFLVSYLFYYLYEKQKYQKKYLKNLSVIEQQDKEIERMLSQQNIDREQLEQLKGEFLRSQKNYETEKNTFEDIITEVENKYQDLFDQKKILSEKASALEARIKQNNKDKLDLTQQIQDKEIKLEGYNKKINDADQRLHQENEYSQQKVKKLVDEINVLQKKVKDTDSITHKYQQQYQSMHTELRLQEDKLEANKIEVKNLKLKIEKTEQDYNSALSEWELKEKKYKQIIDDKSHFIKKINAERSNLENANDTYQDKIDSLNNEGVSTKRVFDILLTNPDIKPKEQGQYQYSESIHGSKQYVDEVNKSISKLKVNSIKGFVGEVRSAKYNTNYCGHLEIVQDYAVSTTVQRKGYGVIAYDKKVGYGAYIHLNANNLTEAVLITKALQYSCSVFKKYKILPINKIKH